ncbi:MAG: branched-chain amino acid ABC transporter permease [Pigmentiphaga sp.]|nr:branched-chain amino acid ABC transporter permease [Pigmentiphaga sp.]
MQHRYRPLGIGLLAVLAVALPLLTDSPYVLGIGITSLTFAVLAMSLNLVLGYGGLLSFGQVGFFGLGAYTAALLVVDAGWNFWPAALAGALLATVFGLVIGFVSLRLSRHAFVIVTLAFTVILELVAKDWSILTRGPAGLPGLPPPEIGGFQIEGPQHYYWLALAVAAVLLALVYRVIQSPAGRLMQAIKMNEALAKSQGIHPLPYRLLAIGLSAFIAAIIGAVHVFNLSVVDPTIFHFYYAEAILIMVLLGGVGGFWGVIAAAVVFSIVPELLRITVDARAVIYGVLLVVMMRYMPEGLGGLPQRWQRWRARQQAREEASHD